MTPKPPIEDPRIEHLKLAVIYAAYVEILNSTAGIYPINEGDSEDTTSRDTATRKERGNALNGICECAGVYLSLQHALFRSSEGAVPVGQGVTEDDLKRLLGTKYGELKKHVQTIEWIFSKLTKGIELKTGILWRSPFPGRFKKDFRSVIDDMSHGRSGNTVRVYISFIVRVCPRVAHFTFAILQKALQRTQTVLETFRENMTTPDWSKIPFLRENVKWKLEQTDAEEYLMLLREKIEGMRKVISGRQIFPWPESSRDTSVTCWKMHLAPRTEGGQTELAGAHSSHMTADISQGFQQLKDCVEGRAQGNGKQTEVPNSYFVPGAKYRGLYPLEQVFTTLTKGQDRCL
jgi:hypothetical protein